MIITVEQLVQIASTGGGLVLDASVFTFFQLRQIVDAAGGAKTTITLHNVSGYTAQQLIELSGLAPSLITFDLTS